MSCHFATLGMFIIDEFSFLDEAGNPTAQIIAPQIGGGGTYANIGARVWLPASQVGMIIDHGSDFPPDMESKLAEFGKEMWIYRDQPSGTTRALNTYRGDHRRCVPEELDALIKVLPQINILSPNAEEALGLLSLPLPPSKRLIEEAAHKFLQQGVGPGGKGCVIIRSGSMGACVALKDQPMRWVPAFWSSKDEHKIVDVTGAGNSFLGGLAAGLLLENGDVYQASFHASVAASFVIEQAGLPTISVVDGTTLWNGDSPQRRLDELKKREIEVEG
ncbi:Ribokinase-like protein [Mycena sanguinolenta]|uniref:Ribokinase-like protein n=1 Tax=Mycena sanguinolenta TaxID=230812 RepID=A0A8H6Y8F5_9AGAR|nr:Ribokinase-like protein [Mycena sanguinolenta]